MKHFTNLYPYFCSFKNLLLAYRKVKSGSRKNGERAACFFDLENRLLAIQDSLLDKSYMPDSYRYFQINEPKKRLVSVATVRDRIVHHALVNVLTPLYEPYFIFDSYANRQGKGTQAAIQRAQLFVQKNSWFAKFDILKYFDSIDHSILLQLLAKRICDKDLLLILERVIANGGANGKGLPIGNLTSQFFANVYLDELDKYVKQTLHVRHYIRYMDDFVLFSPDKDHLKIQQAALATFLEEQLKLRINPASSFLNKAQNGLSFLGVRIFRTQIRTHPKSLKLICAKIRRKNYLLAQGLIGADSFIATMNSYYAHLKKYTPNSLKKRIFVRATVAERL